MTTNTGQNWAAVVWLVMSAITAMDTGTEKTILLAAGMAVMALIASALGWTDEQLDTLFEAAALISA